MKIATGIVVISLALAIAADAATTRPVDENGQSAWVDKDRSAAWPDMRAIKERNETTVGARDPRVQGRKSPADFKSGATTRLEYHDKLLRQQARENKINALDRRCDGNNSPLCRKHNGGLGGEARRRS
jgi:hypothetical protein